MSSGAADEAGPGGGPLLLNQPIILDNGSATIKAGFAGSSRPKVVLGTRVGRAKHTRVMPGGALEQEGASVYVGQRLDEHRGAFLLEHPMDRGAVVDGGWDAMEALWQHVYSKHCLNAKHEEHPVLMTEAPLNPRRNRDRIAELMFETIRAPALFFAPPSVLSLYASGRTTGVVLDVGDTVTHAVPVYEGFALPHSVVRSDVAGRDVTRELQRQLRRAGLAFTTTAEADLARTIKEEACFLATPASGPAEAAAAERDARVPYQLPDGSVVQLGAERHAAPNVLFDPSLIGSEEPGAAEVLLRAVMRSDIDLRSKLFSQIVLAGGSTLTPRFGDRLLYDLRVRSPAHTRIRISAPPERLHSCYVGGSILASLATFKNMWVSREEYAEQGSRSLHRSEL